MTTRAKHTHVGHCQSCGATHAVELRNECIAKHGYTVDWGYFAGTCSGSGVYPLEVARDHCDNIIDSCERAALSHTASAKELRAGKTRPERCDNGQKCVSPGKWETVWVSWADANETLRRQQIEREIAEHERHANFMIDHAAFLFHLAAGVHGLPLRRVKPSVNVDVRPGATFTVATDKRYEIVRTGLPGGYGGRRLYTEVRKLDDGRILRMTTAYVRRQLKDATNV